MTFGKFFGLALFCTSSLASAQTPCSSEVCQYAKLLVSTKAPTHVGGFENGPRIVAFRADGSVVEVRVQFGMVHEAYMHLVHQQGKSLQDFAKIAARQMKEGICTTLPPSAWQKQLLAKGGTLRYTTVSFDEIELLQLDLSSCSSPVVERALTKGLAAKYAKRNAEARHWAATKGPYVYSPDVGCSQWEYGAPASLWGNQEQVRETWTQPDSQEWGALTGFYANSEPVTYYFTKDTTSCAKLADLLGKAKR